MPGQLESHWDKRRATESGRFINPDMTIAINTLRNFRKLMVFISDEPLYRACRLNPINWISGRRRAVRKLLARAVGILEERGYADLLEKYPSSRVGNPYTFAYKGRCPYTYRWLKHTYGLGLFRDYLAERLSDDFTLLDIGSSYGVFSYLLKRQYPRSCQVLLDFPEQIVLGHYFLGMNFPDARIASLKDITHLETIDRAFLSEYDFVLAPLDAYRKFSPGSFDVIVNFASLGEMTREWFNFYLHNEPFISTRFFFTANKIQSYPTHNTDVTILDYPLGDFQRLCFGISPLYSTVYLGKLFTYEKINLPSPIFDFIGERTVSDSEAARPVARATSRSIPQGDDAAILT